MLTLRFNAESFFNDYIEFLVDAANECMERFLSDARIGLGTRDQEVEAAKVTAEKIITSKCVFYAQSILKSYGTGKKMDTSNEALTEYMQSRFWNPLRKSSAIAGRPKGRYENIFGEMVESSGALAGVDDISGIMKKTYGLDIEKKPTYSIQNAEKKLKQVGGYVDRIISNYTDDFISTMNPSKYFYNEEV